MKAMVLEEQGQPLRLEEIERPRVESGQVLLRVRTCGVCRTDLHVVDGDLPDPKLPLIPGHQIVGEVLEVEPGTTGIEPGSRIGVPWMGWTCGECRFCRSGRENLCEAARFTGYQIDGGYAEYAVADARFCFPIPIGYADRQAAPLLCAGLIGYRSLVMAGDAERLGLYGFGAAAHIIAQVAIYQGRRVFAFTRPGDTEGQRFALELGAEWAGSSGEAPPGDHLRTRRLARAPGARRRREGGNRRVRRNSHERDPGVSLRGALGGASRAVGRQPDTTGWGGVPATRSANGGAHGGQFLSVGGGQPGAGRPARWTYSWCRRPRHRLTGTQGKSCKSDRRAGNDG